jgi:FMN reductase
VASGRPLEILAVYGAATPPGRLSLALETVVQQIAERDARVGRVSLHDAELGVAGTRRPEEQDEPTQEAVRAVLAAHAVLIGSPVYRASLPGVLKNLLDLLPVEALRGKPVGLVVVGATHHHFLGVDRHLRDILSWFGALALPVSVYLTSADFVEGRLTDSAVSELHELASTLLALARATRGLDLGPPPLAERQG